MAYSQVNLADLPAPKLVREIAFEDILAEMKAACVRIHPTMEPILQVESEPAVKVLEVAAAYVMMLRAEINDAARGVLLAYATGSDLDHLGALFGVERYVLQEATDISPVEFETDVSFRARIQMSFEGFSSAGPRGAYDFHARSADGRVKDVSVVGPQDAGAITVPPGQVNIYVLSSAGNGAAPDDLISSVSAAVNAEDVRPLCDTVVVQSATIQNYTVAAAIEVFDGPDRAVILAEAQAALADYLAASHALGATIARSGIHGALHRPGVRRVTLTQPAADIVTPPNTAPYATSVTVTIT